jgi:alkylation response protein AidB-like acyl-CoA dehydrogenase
MAQAAMDEAVKYAKTRIVKGKPLSQMQGVQWTLADMHAKLEAARLLTYRTAFLADSKALDWMTAAAAAKLFVVPVTQEITEKARQIHGSYGYTKGFKIERLSRAIAGAGGIATSLDINRSIVGNALVNRG